MPLQITSKAFQTPPSLQVIESRFTAHDGFVGTKAVESKIMATVKLAEQSVKKLALAGKPKVLELTSLLDPKSGEPQGYVAAFGFNNDPTRVCNQVDYTVYFDAKGKTAETTLYVNGALQEG